MQKEAEQNLPIRKLSRSTIKNKISHISWPSHGRVCEIVGTIVEATLPNSKLGHIVEIAALNSSTVVLAEVVGFREDRALLIPFSSLNGIGSGSLVSRQREGDFVDIDDSMLGKIFDPFLNCLSDTSFKIGQNPTRTPIENNPPNPMERERISKPLSLGVRAIDGLLTFGDGQRLGIMAGSGVGKSVLLGMMAKGSEADINVIGLIGERGREVREFLEKDLGEEGLKKSIVISVTSDQSPLMKIRAAKVIHSIAEYFSAKGNRVLLMMDSLTRVAMAQREIGLAIGEPPSTKGYTPSVFSILPKILERSGPQKKDHGPISALYTVLVDGDDFNDPIADAARSILDGQINLTRRLASKGHFPAIDIGSSISRCMPDIIPTAHRMLATKFKSYMGSYEENFDLIQIGAYQPGANRVLDKALKIMPAIERYLTQDLNEQSTFTEAQQGLQGLLFEPEEMNANG